MAAMATNLRLLQFARPSPGNIRKGPRQVGLRVFEWVMASFLSAVEKNVKQPGLWRFLANLDRNGFCRVHQTLRVTRAMGVGSD